MDYIDELRQFSSRVTQLAPLIKTEEATKNALILPFFQLLGYDVFNPVEFVPEFTADVGIKKGERVDYAIVLDGVPTILIEAKWCGEVLQNHDSQLFRYYGTTPARLAILTNGIVYRFYTDLDEQNKMDLTPFMEFNVLDIKDGLITELKRFHRKTLNVDDIFSAASDLKYTSAIKQLLTKQAADPDDDFTSYIMREVYPGRRTATVTEKFKTIIKRSFSQYVNELLNDRFKSMLTPPEDKQVTDESDDTQPEETDGTTINTTAEELEAFLISKALLHEVVDVSRIFYKDTVTYFAVLLDNKATKWICRFQIEGKKKFIIFPTKEGEKDLRVQIDGNDSIYQYKDRFVEAVGRYL